MNSIPEVLLFCGVKLTSPLAEKLARLPHSIKDPFIGHPVGDLKIITSQQTDYLGKVLGPQSESSEMELVETHIHSVLKRLIPDFDAKQHPADLLPIDKKTYVNS